MTKNIITLFLLISSILVIGQESQGKAYFPLDDIATLSGIISTAYQGISGEVGTSRQLEKMRTLYSPNALIFKNTQVNGKPSREVLTLDEFYGGMKDTRESGFFEEEINREVRIFGNIAHVWSTYAIRYEKNGPVISKGINSIQLHFKDNRWWIVSWGWDSEHKENKIPDTFDAH